MFATRKTMSGQAADLGGSWLAANDLNFSERYLAAVKRVTPADLQRVARTHLTTENRTLYALLPNGTATKSFATAVAVSDNAIQKFVLPNGLRLLVKEDHRLPFVEFRAIFQGGVLAENTANNGLTQLLTKLLLKGTKRRSAEDISLEIESVGGSIDTYGGNNSFGLNVETMSSDFAKGLDLLADVTLNPTFPAAALEREQQIQIAGIRSQKDELLKSAAKAMRRALFGDIGYGLDSLGTEASVQSIKPTDLKAFHKQLVTPNNCVLAVYGDVKAIKVKAALQKAFARWKPGAAPADFRLQTSDSRLTNVKRVVETRDKKQAVLVIGFNGTTLLAEDRYALELLQEACSDLGSRLFLRIRDQLGLAYYVGAQNFMGLTPGYFAFYTGTHPEKVELVECELLKEAELLRTEGLSAEELSRAKAKIIGQTKIARQDLGNFAMHTALDELYGLGYANTDAEDAKYEAVTLEQVKAVAQKYLDTNAVVISIVKP
jgi:zinc protease